MLSCLEDVLNLFYPRICSGCGVVLFKHELLICLPCRAALPFTGFKLHEENPVSLMFRGRLSGVRGTAMLYFRNRGLARELMHSLKYDGNRELAHHLGNLFGEIIRSSEPEIREYTVTCVPIHPAKRRRRGYNQSEVIARGISEALGARFCPELLVKRRDSETQTRKRRFDRWLNSEMSYQLGSFKGGLPRNVILVDDVITTGATLEACANLLQKAGCEEICICVLCMSVH